MHTTLKLSISSIARKAHTQFVSSFLALKNAMLRRTMYVGDVDTNGPLIIKGSPIEIVWEARGCHKVTINDDIVVPGNTSGILLNLQSEPRSFELVFYGFRKTIERSVHVIPLRTDFEISSKPRLELRVAREIQGLPRLASDEVTSPPTFSVPRPQTAFQELNLCLPAFDLSKYSESLES